MIEDIIINKEANERTVLVGLVTQQQNEVKANEYLDELAFLAETAGAEPVRRLCRNSTILIRRHTSVKVNWKKYANMLRIMKWGW